MRLDKYLVEHNFVETRSKALNLIRENLVLVNGSKPQKAGQVINENDKVQVLDHKDFVSRSARKLLYALEDFGVNELDGVALDIGASTGGFCQVLLEKGVSKVYAIDSGTNQLRPTLKSDSRIVDLSPVNAKDPLDLQEKISVVTCDVSFISNLKILPNITNSTDKNTKFFVLFKPQFEGQSSDLNSQGVVKENSYWKIYKEYKSNLKKLGFDVLNETNSKVIGKKGNKEKILQLTYVGN